MAQKTFSAVPAVVDRKSREDLDVEAGYYFHKKKLGEGTCG